MSHNSGINQGYGPGYGQTRDDFGYPRPERTNDQESQIPPPPPQPPPDQARRRDPSPIRQQQSRQPFSRKPSSSQKNRNTSNPRNVQRSGTRSRSEHQSNATSKSKSRPTGKIPYKPANVIVKTDKTVEISSRKHNSDPASRKLGLDSGSSRPPHTRSESTGDSLWDKVKAKAGSGDYTPSNVVRRRTSITQNQNEPVSKSLGNAFARTFSKHGDTHPREQSRRKGSLRISSPKDFQHLESVPLDSSKPGPKPVLMNVKDARLAESGESHQSTEDVRSKTGGAKNEQAIRNQTQTKRKIEEMQRRQDTSKRHREQETGTLHPNLLEKVLESPRYGIPEQTLPWEKKTKHSQNKPASNQVSKNNFNLPPPPAIPRENPSGIERPVTLWPGPAVDAQLQKQQEMASLPQEKSGTYAASGSRHQEVDTRGRSKKRLEEHEVQRPVSRRRSSPVSPISGDKFNHGFESAETPSPPSPSPSRQGSSCRWCNKAMLSSNEDLCTACMIIGQPPGGRRRSSSTDRFASQDSDSGTRGPYAHHSSEDQQFQDESHIHPAIRRNGSSALQQRNNDKGKGKAPSSFPHSNIPHNLPFSSPNVPNFQEENEYPPVQKRNPPGRSGGFGTGFTDSGRIPSLYLDSSKTYSVPRNPWGDSIVDEPQSSPMDFQSGRVKTGHVEEHNSGEHESVKGFIFGQDGQTREGEERAYHSREARDIESEDEDGYTWGYHPDELDSQGLRRKTSSVYLEDERLDLPGLTDDGYGGSKRDSRWGEWERGEGWGEAVDLSEQDDRKTRRR